jgi:hypothetical protein
MHEHGLGKEQGAGFVHTEWTEQGNIMMMTREYTTQGDGELACREKAKAYELYI